MIIRCERCSTLYELDEALLAPEGSPVQCTRCQAVFTAAPPRPAPRPPAAGHAAQEPPAAGTPAVEGPPAPRADPPVAPQAPAEPSPRPASPQEEAPPPPATAPPGSEARPRTAGGLGVAPRAVRSGPNVYRPPAPASAPAGHAARPGPGVPRGTVGAFEARAQLSNLWRRLLLPGVALLVAGLVLGGMALWRGRPDPDAQRLATEAGARLSQDDGESLARSVQLLDELLSRSPERGDLVAERALARLLQAAAQLEEAEPMEAQLAATHAQRERLLAEPAPGSEDAARLLAVEAGRLEVELAPRRKAAASLTAQAVAELQRLAAVPGGERQAARGRAVAAALQADRTEVARQAALARATGPDPWADLAEAWLDLAAQGEPAEVLARLGALAHAHPELIRARFLLARAQVAAGKREEALTTLGGLLAANPRHERAQRLRARLAAPPAAAQAPAVAPAPAAAPAATPAQPGANRPAPPHAAPKAAPGAGSTPAPAGPPPPVGAAGPSGAPALAEPVPLPLAPVSPAPEAAVPAPVPEQPRVVAPPPAPPRREVVDHPPSAEGG